ncbi:MAG TPA: ABC transporter substrate-binding protein [Tepidisphaeraceae bacterium]|nr:ABC transporter substrate-binding protein [Tepidisphaeraceae bacterium]
MRLKRAPRTAMPIWGGAILVVLSAMLGGALICNSGCQPRNKSHDNRTVVSVWHPWGSDQIGALRAIVAEFEKEHPHIRIKLSYASNNLTNSQKLLLAIAGGVAPDVTFVDGQQLAEWAARGALTDITSQVRAAHLGEKDFFKPRWEESTFQEHVYALPWGADPNFALVWNKRLFKQCGLNPNKPPTTIAELDADNDKITKLDAHGGIVRMGIIPWDVGGDLSGDNAMFTWGYAFGGDFYIPPKPGQLVGTVTADNPHNVAALAWLASYGKKYNMRKIMAFRGGFLGQANNPLYLDRLGMEVMHITQIPFIHRYAPGLDYGITFVPAPPGGEYHSGWIGGWSLAIPRGAKVTPAAFEFIRWMCTSDAGTMAMGKQMTLFPAYKASPFYPTIKNDPVLGVYYQILIHSKHVRTLMPVQGYFMDLLRRGFAEVMYTANESNPANPKDVLHDISIKAQDRLEQVMREVERRKEDQ